MFKMQLTENKMIAITFVLVVLMAFPTYQTLAQNEGSEDSQNLASSSDRPSAVREPASISPQVLKNSKPNPHFQTVNLKCAKKAFSPANVTGPFVQFQGKNCLANFRDGDVEIINKRNGFTASIFPRGSDQYQTDLIQLERGENEITIRYHDGVGKPVEESIHITSSAI